MDNHRGKKRKIKRPHQGWRGKKNPPLNKCPFLLEKICLAVDEHAMDGVDRYMTVGRPQKIIL